MCNLRRSAVALAIALMLMASGCTEPTSGYATTEQPRAVAVMETSRDTENMVSNESAVLSAESQTTREMSRQETTGGNSKKEAEDSSADENLSVADEMSREDSSAAGDVGKKLTEEVEDSSLPEEESVAPTEALKSLDEIAWDVLNGKWGHGEERRANLTVAGYDYDEVQRRVGEMVAEVEAEKAAEESERKAEESRRTAEEAEKKTEESSKKAEPVQEQESKPAEEPKAESSKAEPKPELKSIDEIAQEVIDGKWSANDERRQMLTAAGYDYEAVQTRVNELVAEMDAKAAEEAAKKAAEESARKAEEEAAKAAEESERKTAEESAQKVEEEAQKAAEEAEAEEPVSEEEPKTAEDEIPTAPWSEFGTAGRLMSYDVGLNVALYSVSISDGAANQEVVDERNSAAYMVYGNQVVIADHHYHGFNQLWYAEVGDTAYIEQSDGSKQYMTVTRIEPNGHNAGSMLVDNDWNNAYESDADVLMYTCNPIGGSSVTILYWNYS